MIRTLLGFLGYMRVPKEAVQLSILVEDCLKQISRDQPDESDLCRAYRASKILTWFLRSGRLLN